MQNIYISNIAINKVRHLKDFDIELSTQEIKHLIITGKNGSGKTSLLNSIATFLNSITNSNDPMEAMRNLETDKKNLLSYEKKKILIYKSETQKNA